MAQNLVIPNSDNLVALTFAGAFFSTATDVKVIFGAETYTSLLDPTIVIINSDDQLSLNLSDTAETGKVFVTIKRFDVDSVYGTDITSRELNNLDQIVVSISSQLTVENGSQVVGANSYVSDAEYIAYAALKGLTIGSTQTSRQLELLKGMDYLHNLEQLWQGTRASSTQELSFPRYNVLLYGYLLSSDKIPKELKDGQCEAAFYSNTANLLISGAESNVSSFSVDGAVSESYFKGGSMERVRLDSVKAKLRPLLEDTTKLVRT
jgi:hypothetical protein